MNRQRLQLVADKIDTGAGDLTVARALVVFNITDADVNGVARFPAEIGWQAGQPMPGIAVRELGGVAVPSTVRFVSESQDTKGRPDRARLKFELLFQVTDVPARGWRTYVAEYGDPSDAPLPADAGPTQGLHVLETAFHGGPYGPVGTVAA